MSRFRILVYHRIGKEDSPDGLTMGVSAFREQMETLRCQYHPISLEKAVEKLSSGNRIPPRSVAVTFDDGYRDTFEVAFPILRKNRIPATLFLATGYLDSPGSSSRPPMLSWRMVRQMRRQGMEVGSHTVSHPNLLTCASRQLRLEIVSSKKRLEQVLGEPVTLFAYPYGHARSFNLKIRRMVQEAGYRSACSTLPGDNAVGVDPYALRRTSFAKREIRRFAWELSRLSDDGSPNPSGAIQGVNGRTSRLWKKRYEALGRRLRPEEFFF